MTHRQEQILPFSFGTTIKENQNTRGRTMGLQNIFDMVKAERYTQDGRKEIIKAQKETKDARRTYKNGEISEKTGLMKTANGWVEPPANKGAERNHGVKKEKRGKGAIHTTGTGNISQEKMKEAAEKGLKGEELKNFFLNKTEPSKSINEWEESAKTEAKNYNENMVVMQNAKGETTIIREGSPDIDKAETKGYKKMSLVRPDGSVKKHEENNKEFSDTENHAAKSDKWQKNTDYLGRERISMKTPQGGAVSIYENPTRKNGRFRVDTGSHYNEFNTMEEAKAFAEKHYGESDNNKSVREAVHEMNMKSKEAAANRANERRQKEHDPDYKPEGKKALKLPDEKSSFQTDVNRMKKLKQQDYKQYTIQLEKLHSKYPINKWTALYDKTTRDSAPLTGDCKIRVRKS